MSKQRFFICNHCKNVIAYVDYSGVDVYCCGEKMQEIIPNTVDASSEKHVPVVNKFDNKVVVSVGSVEHPMLKEHHIAWISIETKEGNQRKEIKVGEKPEATFYLSENDEVVNAYAYCNLHGLWKK